MKVLVLGQGGREHALSWLFSKSRSVKKIYIAEGNAGTALLGENVPDVNPSDGRAIVALAKKIACDVVFVGPEAPAASGVVDALQEAGIPVIGPNRRQAELESSKVFSKNFLRAHAIPTAESKEFDQSAPFEKYIAGKRGKKIVVKKNGLAAGKGVLESAKEDELIGFGKSILKTDSLLVEEFLEGWEVSIFAISDGKTFQILLPCTDFKKAFDNDSGPNTGGMGSICPVPRVDGTLSERILQEIVEPTFRGLEKDGIAYKGVVYFGLMITEDGPKVLEYNVRFGDPEAQVLLPLIKTDFGKITEALCVGRLAELTIEFHEKAAVGVVVAAKGYPDQYEKGIEVSPLTEPPENEALLFHASTKRSDGKVETGGGRCFTVVGFGANLQEAAGKAYQYIDRIRFEGAWYRRDIGKKFFSQGKD
jgi:phosphoribosylamine--glycine ligase